MLLRILPRSLLFVLFFRVMDTHYYPGVYTNVAREGEEGLWTEQPEGHGQKARVKKKW